jgi:RHS repeat-associated protein
MIARDRNADGNTATGTGGLEQRVYAVQDANWNTTAIIAATGVPGVSGGALINRFAYTPYGEVQTLTASWTTPPAGSTPAVPWAHLFQGLEFTDVTALAYVRHRDYSASLGRFIELDPIGFDAGDNNWYRFVGNQPSNATDPTGERPWPVSPQAWPRLPDIRSGWFEEIIAEAKRRRGHGPWQGSAQHCWAACYFGAVYGVGNLAAVFDDFAEAVLGFEDDWWRDVQAQHYGGWVGGAFNWSYMVGCHTQTPESYCDEKCKTWP